MFYPFYILLLNLEKLFSKYSIIHAYYMNVKRNTCSSTQTFLRGALLAGSGLCMCVWPPQHVGIVNGSWFKAASHPPPSAVSFSVSYLSHTQTYGLTYWQTDFGGNTLPLLQTHWQQYTQSVVLCYELHRLLCGFYIEPPFYTSIDCVNTGYSNCCPCFSSSCSHVMVIWGICTLHC